MAFLTSVRPGLGAQLATYSVSTKDSFPGSRALWAWSQPLISIQCGS